MIWVNTVFLMTGILFSLYVLYITAKRKATFLSIFFVAYILLFLKYLIPELRLVYHSFDQLTWLIGPLVYFIVTKDKEKFKRKQLIHFIPFLLVFNIILFYEQLNINFIIIEFLFSPILRSSHSIIYILLAALEAKNSKKAKWIIITMSLLLTITYIVSYNLLETDLLNIYVTLGLIMTGLSSLNFIKEPKPVIKNDVESLNVYHKVLNHINDNQLYLNQNLKLSDLSGLLKINEKLISKAINTHAKENFNAFINRFRVKHATTLINKGNYSYYTIDAIAEESGFSNKVSFYKAFKRIESISPSKYRENAENGAKQIISSIPS